MNIIDKRRIYSYINYLLEFFALDIVFRIIKMSFSGWEYKIIYAITMHC